MPNYWKRSEADLQQHLNTLRAKLEEHPQKEDIQLLLEDLQVHQIELELQNRELRTARHELEQARDRYADLYDFAPVGYVILASSGRIDDINLTGARLLNVDREQITGMPLSAFLQAGELLHLYDHLKKAFASPGKVITEIRVKPRGGACLNVRLESLAVKLASGGVACRSAMIDVTESRRVDAALRESEERYRTLFTQSPDGIFVIQQNHVILVNSSGLRLFGADRTNRLMGHSLYDLFHTDSRSDIERLVQRVRDSAATMSPLEEKIIRLDGQSVDVEVVAAPFPFHGMDAVHVILRDITNRKALEQQVIEVSTSEQERIGREIHDGIGQQLTALAMLANSLARRLTQKRHAPEAEAASDLATHIQEVLQDARTLSRGLSPIQIAPDELPDALALLVERTRSVYGITCLFENSGAVETLEENVAIHLYRIAQEAIHNAIKHATASQIVVTLRNSDHKTVLSIRDDGIGMDPAKGTDHQGLGTHIMRYRTRVIGASLGIAPAPGGGTLVECTWHRPTSGLAG